MALTESRVFGSVLGSCGGFSAGYGASWSGLGDSGVHVWIIALASGAVLGAFTWPALQNPDDESAPHWVYGGLFAGCVALLAGAFAAYPFGALFGASGGAVGGAVSTLIANRIQSGLSPQSAAGTALLGGLVGLLFVAGVSP